VVRIKEHYESGQYQTTTDAENEFRRLAESDLAVQVVGLTNGRPLKMQFGRICGIGLMVLGIVLCFLQFVRYAAQPKKEENSAQAVLKEQHVTSLPGIVGVGSLGVGIAFFVTARRKDEPNPKYRLK